MRMMLRVLVGLLVALVVALPVAQHASAAPDLAHAAALKHAPRTPPSSARIADVVRPRVDMPAAVLAGPAASPPPCRPSLLAPTAPFVPPRV
jgi:hypothetical protein